MRQEISHNDQHSGSFLPAYLNGTLDARRAGRVREHLARCPDCQAELAAWQAIQEMTLAAAAAAPAPSLALLEGVWERLDAPTPVQHPWRQTALHRGRHLWAVWRGQAPLVRQGVWITSAALLLVIALGCFVAFLLHNKSMAEALFAFCAPLVAGLSVLTIYQPGTDPRLELALASPTSPRAVLLSRVLLLLGYDLALSLGATALLTLLFGDNFWAVGALWFGPMLLVTMLSVLLSLLLGTLVALVSTLLLALAHLLAQGTLSVDWLNSARSALDSLWQTNPMVIVLALTFLLLALVYAPRQERVV